jgi:hypothetical protein
MGIGYVTRDPLYIAALKEEHEDILTSVMVFKVVFNFDTSPWFGCISVENSFERFVIFMRAEC